MEISLVLIQLKRTAVLAAILAAQGIGRLGLISTPWDPGPQSEFQNPSFLAFKRKPCPCCCFAFYLLFSLPQLQFTFFLHCGALSQATISFALSVACRNFIDSVYRGPQGKTDGFCASEKQKRARSLLAGTNCVRDTNRKTNNLESVAE